MKPRKRLIGLPANRNGRLSLSGHLTKMTWDEFRIACKDYINGKSMREAFPKLTAKERKLLGADE